MITLEAPEAGPHGARLSRRPVLEIVLVLGVCFFGSLFAFRGLITGIGTYQIYIDPGIPTGTHLLSAACAQQSELLTSVNLGTRVLYPSSYLFCGAIRAALSIGFPAWFFSRVMPFLLTVVAACSMAFVVLRLMKDWAKVNAGFSWPEPLLAAMIGLMYALSPYSLTELAASHIYYLVALAALPIVILLVDVQQSEWTLTRAVLAGVGVAVALTQLQYVVIVPLALVLYRCFQRTKNAGYVKSSLLALGIAAVAQLPWLIPLLRFRSLTSLSTYVETGSLQGFSIDPINSLRFFGYPTPFESDVLGRLQTVYTVAAFIIICSAIWATTQLRRRYSMFTSFLILIVIIYVWGAEAPLYGVWKAIVPAIFSTLFRERYSLLGILLIWMILGLAVAAARLSRDSAVEAVVVALALLLVFTLGFADGHLGEFGSTRSTFPGQENLYKKLASLEKKFPGSVLSIPEGSIVKGTEWKAFGRNPFTQYGPGEMLDAEGTPSSAALTSVSTLVELLGEKSSCELVNPVLEELGVRYVVQWKYLAGDLSPSPQSLLTELISCGFNETINDKYRALYVDKQIEAKGVVTSRYLTTDSAVSFASSTVAQAWGSPTEIASNVKSALGSATKIVANHVVHLGIRDINIGDDIQGSLLISEPITQLDDLHKDFVLRYRISNPSSKTLVFSDGAPIRPDTSPEVAGPISTTYLGSEDELDGNQLIDAAIPSIQDTGREKGLSLRAAGISASRLATGVEIRAVKGIAGLPIKLPVRGGRYYDIQIKVNSHEGPPASAALVANNSSIASTVLRGPSTETLGGVLPSNAVSAYLYIYQPSGSAPGAMDVSLDDVSISRATSIAPSPQQPQLVGVLRAAPSRGQSQVSSLQGKALKSLTRQIQNVANVAGLSLRASGISASVIGTSEVSVSSKKGIAGLPIGVSQTEGGSVSVQFEYEDQGSSTSVRVVGQDSNVVTNATLPEVSGWHPFALRFVLGTGEADPYIYLLVRSTSQQPGTTNFRSIRISSFAAPPPYVIDARMKIDNGSNGLPKVRETNSGLEWVSVVRSYDPWYALQGGNHSVLLPMPSDGVGITWLTRQGNRALDVSYRPEQWFQILRWIVGSLFIVALLFALAWDRYLFKRKHRFLSKGELMSGNVRGG